MRWIWGGRIESVSVLFSDVAALAAVDALSAFAALIALALFAFADLALAL